MAIISSSIPQLSSAQQELRDDSYIYHNYHITTWEAKKDYMSISNNTAVIYKDSLYKNIDMRAFLKKTGLITDDFNVFEKAEDIVRITQDTCIKLLFVKRNDD